MSELIGLFLEIFAGVAPRRGEYGKAFIATVAAIILILAFVAATLSFLTLAG